MKSVFKLTVLFLCLGLLWATGAPAQTGLPSPNAGFDFTGFIQTATLRATPRPGVDPLLRGGSISVQGKGITVPDNTLVQFPASTWTWPQLFDYAAWSPVYDPAIVPAPLQKPAPPAGTTGLALRDPLVNNFPSYEVRVVGNIVTNPTNGFQDYIAGLIVPVTQQGLSAQSGYINFIDYSTGRFRIGGIMGDANTGLLCEINDPVGRFGLIHSPDRRFTADTSNPTITASTGYPVCIPRVSLAGNDPLCPKANRPLNGNPAFPRDPFLAANAPLKRFTMPAAPGGPNTVTPDPYQMVPLMVGDWVDISGTMFKIDPTGPRLSTNEYISVHTLTAHLGIKTAPGTVPAYVRVEEFLFGVGDGQGGPTVSAGNPPTPIAQETSTRVQMVAFTTDSDAGGLNLPTAALFGIHVLADGTEVEQPFPNGAAIAINDPVRGRLRFQVSKNGTETPGVLLNAVGPGNFYREYVLKLSTGQTPLPNGLIAGQYRLPIFEYIFGEGTNFGEPWPPFNFNDFGFLAVGNGVLGGVGSGGPVIGRLVPFPHFQ